MIERGPWDVTPGLIDRFVELFEDEAQHTTAVIARMLSAEFNLVITKNSVVGKSRRLLLHRVAVNGVVPAPMKKKRNSRKVISVLPIEPIEAPSARCEGAVTIYDLRTKDCRWPLGPVEQRAPFLYCAKLQAEGSSYCPTHDRVARPGAYRHG